MSVALGLFSRGGYSMFHLLNRGMDKPRSFVLAETHAEPFITPVPNPAAPGTMEVFEDMTVGGDQAPRLKTSGLLDRSSDSWSSFR